MTRTQHFFEAALAESTPKPRLRRVASPEDASGVGSGPEAERTPVFVRSFEAEPSLPGSSRPGLVSDAGQLPRLVDRDGHTPGLAALVKGDVGAARQRPRHRCAPRGILADPRRRSADPSARARRR